MKNTLLHYLLPTCDPDAFFKNVFDKLEMYEPLKEFISFGVNFQSPWTEEQINEVINKFNSLGIKIYWECNTYNKDSYRFPFVSIRETCAKLNPTAIYYCAIDDDIEYFCSPDIYCKIICNCIQYMERYNVAAITLCRDKVRGIKSSIIDRMYGGTWTGYGLLYKNRYSGNITPNNCFNLWGNHEDNISGFFALLNNYEVAYAGVNIANHTLGYKPKETQTGRKFKLYECTGLPGTVAYQLGHFGNRFLGFDLKKFLNQPRYSYIKPEFINYKTDLEIQIKNLKDLYYAKNYDLVENKNIKKFNPYNFINYNVVSDDFTSFKTLVIDNLYLFTGIGEICSFSVWCPNFTDDQIKYMIDEFNKNFVTLNYSKSSNVNLNFYAPIQKLFSEDCILGTTTSENCLNILNRLLSKDTVDDPFEPKYLSSYLDNLIDVLIKHMEKMHN